MSDLPTNQDEPERLWTPRTFVFFSAIVVANLLLSSLLITPRYVWVTNLYSEWAETVVYATIGSMTAQILVLAIWAALFPGKNSVRWAIGSLVLFASSLGLEVFYEWTWSPRLIARAEFLAMLHRAAFFMLAFYLVQVPFWLCRRLLGWRIVREPQRLPQHDPPLRILDLLGMTAFVAAAMAAGRVAFFVMPAQWYFLITIAIGETVMCIFGMACLWAVFRVKARANSVFACFVISQGFAWSFVGVLYALGAGGPLFSFVAVGQGLALGFAAVAFVNGSAVRAYGYQLVSRTERQRRQDVQVRDVQVRGVAAAVVS
jgi:hypothetical protein